MKRRSWFALAAAAALAGAARAADAVPAGETPVLGEIVAAVRADQLRASVTQLVAFGTRHTLSDPRSDTRGIGAARRWVRARLAAIARDCGGCLEIVTPRATVTGPRMPQPTEVADVVAIQRGTADPQRVIVLTAHLDSRVSDVMDAQSDAPGADDDGSGVAVVLEAARVLSGYRFRASIVYGVLSGEEQGLYGGQILARYAQAQHWFVEGDLNNDIVGSPRGENGVLDNTRVRLFSEATRASESAAQARQRRAEGGELDSPSRNLARYVQRLAERWVPNWHVALVYRVDRYHRGSDHEAFNALGMPAVCFRESAEDYRHQHQDVRVENGVVYGDTLEHVDFDYLAKVAATNLLAAAALAWAPPPPQDVKVSGAVTPDTTVSWMPLAEGAAADLAGYRVWWRDTTAPQWQHARWAGDAHELTLKNLVIDDADFGVSAVSRDGFESPVEFPGPLGAFRPPADDQ
jgi:hypothetical protein